MTITSKEKIIEAATELIIQSGPEQVSLADIARKTGVSKGTLFYHYPSKDELIYDVTDRHFTRTTDELVRWVESSRGSMDIAEVLKVVLETILGAHTRGRLHIYLVNVALGQSPSLRQRFAERYNEWRATIEANLIELMADRSQAAVAASLTLAALDGYVLQTALGINDHPIDEICRFISDCVQAGMPQKQEVE